jgi:hypothetical protein
LHQDGETSLGEQKIWERYELFTRELPEMVNELNIEIDELTFVDFIYVIGDWLKGNPL